MPDPKHIEILEKSRIKYGYRIAVLANWYKGLPHRTIEKEYGLNESENAVLFCLAQSAGLTATDVCQITGRPKNTVSRAARVLLEKALVTRRHDVRDRRRKILDITQKGHKVYKRAETLFVASEQRVIEVLSKEELLQFDALLAKMMRHVVDWAQIF